MRLREMTIAVVVIVWTAGGAATAQRTAVQKQPVSPLSMASMFLAVEGPGTNPDFPAWTAAKTITAAGKVSLRWRTTSATVATAEWQLATTAFAPLNASAEPAGLVARGPAGASPGANIERHLLLDLAPHLPSTPPSRPKLYYLRVVGLDANGKAVAKATNTVTITYTRPGNWGTTLAFPSIETLQGTIFADKEQKKTATLPVAMIGRTIRLTGTDLIEHKASIKVQFLKDGKVLASVTPVTGSIVSLGGGKSQLRATTPVTLDEGQHYVRVEVLGSATSNTKPVYVGPERMDTALFSILNARNVPAVAGVFVSRNGLKGIGAAGSRVHGTPSDVTIKDRWHIGSDTKAMTATLVAILVDRGVIGWNARVSTVFPELSGTMKPALKNVTVAMLLAHRGGLSGSNANTAPGSLLTTEDQSETQRRYEYAKALLHTDPPNTPGVTYEYSNQGYVLVGAMLERVTGKSWEQLMQDELFSPLGMTSAGFGAPGSPDVATQPRGHQDTAGGRVSGFVDNPLALGPAGTVHVNLEDWARFIRLHLNGEEGKVKLAASTLGMLHTAYPTSDSTSYGAGWGINVANQVLSHDGSNNWWYARAIVNLQQGYAVLAVTNIADSSFNSKAASAACGDVVKWMVNRYVK